MSESVSILETPPVEPLLLDSIDLPEGLRNQSIENLARIAQELRTELIRTVSNSGGHFASSLGATEITVALHAAYNTPYDRLVWDVGHQAYIHKMLTGRRDRMSGIRTKEGLSGYLKRTESEFDTFGAGHAGTSISAAVGMSAATQNDEPARSTVAIIGDASISSGMALEALNHAGALQLKRFVVVLNDNEMSISPNVGALSWLFSHAVTSRTSNLIRERFKSMYRKGFVPEILYKAVDRVEEVTQGFFASASMLFESFGFRYIGPVDGHNMSELMTAIEHAKSQNVPVLIHTYTTKGKGYEAAEADPVAWHGVKPFDVAKGAFLSPPPNANVKKLPSFSSVFSKTLSQLAHLDDSVIAITAAMPTGTGLDTFQKEHPDKFYDVGICEQHAVTFAAGLSCEGKKPVCAIYSTFLQRAFDQVVHDVGIQMLPVVFAMDRAGAVGDDGETHQGIFDIAYLRGIPGFVLMSPRDENELQHMLFSALQYNCPVGIRYPRGNGLGVTMDKEFKFIAPGTATIEREGKNVCFIAFGPVVNTAHSVASELERHGVTSTVVNARFAKPLDKKLFKDVLSRHDLICTIEDHYLTAGFGSALLELIQEEGIQLSKTPLRFGLQDCLVTQMTQDQQYAAHGYDAAGILEKVKIALAR